jgi:hypothetical protein
MNDDQLDAALEALVRVQGELKERLKKIGRDFAACRTPGDKRENVPRPFGALVVAGYSPRRLLILLGRDLPTFQH